MAFFEQPHGPAEIRSLPWRPDQSPAQHLRRLARELLPHLTWPDEPGDTEAWREQWRTAFKLRHGEAIQTVNRLVDRMATTARRLRDDVAQALELEAGTGPFSTLLTEVKSQLVGSVSRPAFADMCAQTLVYGALTSRVTDPQSFGASPALSSIPLANPFLTAFFEEVHNHVVQLDAEGGGLEKLVADLKVSEVEAILDQFGSTTKGGDPVIHFYEKFLEHYDAEMKVQAGAFYTPQPAVQFMVRTVDSVLRSRLGLALGIADATSWGELAGRLDLQLPAAIDPAWPFVSMLDPATGTGTFLVEWLRQSKRSFNSVHGPAEWAAHARAVVLPNVRALELMLAPYAVAHLKTALELHDDGVEGEELGIFLTDTLQRGQSGQLTIDPDPISVEGERANEVKRTVRSTICIGNPPYDRVARDAGGGWITDKSGGRSLFDDILGPAIEHTIFSHHASLYNKFVYFWRWTLWKVFEDRPGLPGVVSLITPSSWLTGPGFLGLRQLARELADEIWVVDLGGDNRGTRREENIFEIETPVTIVTVCRAGAGDRSSPAHARYRRILGTSTEKLRDLAQTDGDVDEATWTDSPNAWHASLIPASGATGWESYPLLTDLFPWQQPGCKFGRTWPIAPSAEILEQRWSRLVATDDPKDRARCFVTPSSGRNIHSRVTGVNRLVDEPLGAEAPPIARYGYRSFDRQWAFEDPRMAKTESPSLWASRSDRQVFLVSKPTHPLGRGPAATASVQVPDLDFFRGSFGGKDIIPLYRDADGTPNVATTTLDVLTEAHRATCSTVEPVTVEGLFAYSYAVLAGADYTDRFAEELETPGPRVPLPADPTLFDEAVELGRELLWLHTYGERFADGRRDGSLRSKEIRLTAPITTLPAKASQIHYDRATKILTIGLGRVEGVSPEVWAFEVSGMQIVRKWLGYRTLLGAGRSASSSSPLDGIRPNSWSGEWTIELLELLSVLQRTVDMLPRGVDLLNRICAGPLLEASELPAIPAALRMPRAVVRAAERSSLGL